MKTPLLVPKLVTSLRTYDRSQLGPDVLEEIGSENLFGNLDDALNRARRHVGAAEETPPEGTSPTVAREQIT